MVALLALRPQLDGTFGSFLYPREPLYICVSLIIMALCMDYSTL